MRPYLFKTVSLLIGLLLSVGIKAWAQSVNLSASDGVSISQIDFAAESLQENTNTGLVDIDLITLRETTGMESGYINMVTDTSWLVRNLKVMEEAEYPYSHISTPIDLATAFGTDVSTLTVSVTISDEAWEDYSISTSTVMVAYDVTPVVYSLGGVPDKPVTDAPAPPTMEDVLFGNASDTDAIFQLDHPNIEAAVNQCMPASIANSLQFLENTTDLEIPHEHKMGIKGDDTLVGQLDTHTDRTVVSRRSNSNSGTWGLDGKMKYLAANGLQDQVVTTHMGSGAHSGSDDVSQTVDGKTATATGLGTNISFDTLLNAMKEGQDCELVYAWPGGAHAVDAVAAGKTKGQPWIIHGSDVNQDDDTKGAGASGFEFEYLKDTDNDGQLNLSGTNEELVQVICEKYVAPPPTTVTIISIDDPAGHSCCVMPPPEMIDIILEGDVLTIDGDVPWMPMVGNVEANGDFELNSTATVAGFSNIFNRFAGVYQDGDISNAVVTLGANGGLPQQAPISFDLDIVNNTVEPAIDPVIRANGFRDEFRLDADNPLSVTVTLDDGGQTGQQADWWVVMQSADGLKSYNLATGQFETGLDTSYQGSLFSLPFTKLALYPQGMDSGTYTFYFGVDLVRNGVLDVGPGELIFDSVEVTVP